jgi:hypothetical protein
MPLPSSSVAPTVQGVSPYPTDQSQSQPMKTGRMGDFIARNYTKSYHRHPTIFPNLDIIKGAGHFCMQGDNTFLD